LPALKGPDRWIVAGVSMPARAALSLRLPLGAHTFEVVDARGRRRSIKARLDSPVANLTMADLRVQLGRRTRQPATGTLSPEEIRPVVARGLPRIRACYERALRQAPEMRARLDLRLRVSTRGRVERVRLKGLGDAPARFEGCVTGEAKGWVFPRPRGGPVELSVPLRLEARKGR